MHGDLVRAAKEREPAAWKQSRVSEPVAGSTPCKAIVDTRCVLIWKMVESRKDVKARLVAKRYQAPGLNNFLAGTSGCASLRSSHLRARFSGALQKCEISSPDFKNAFFQADEFQREVWLRAPVEWDPR